MSRVMELEAQIKKLQEEKSRIYSEERNSALIDVKEKIALFEFSARELGIKSGKAAESRVAKRDVKGAGKKAAKKAAKSAAKRAYKSSGIYFDLDGRKVPAGRGRPPKDVSAHAAERGVSTDSLKRNADGTPYLK